MGELRYIIAYPGGVELASNEDEVVEKLRELAPRVKGVLRVFEVGRLVLEADARLLSRLIAPAAPSSGTRLGGKVCAVFDQMYKGFAEIIARELADDRLVLHEIVGRGLEKPLRIGGRLYKQPARDDYDILRLLRSLSKECRVVFFTGDKKLANQAALIENVKVEYMPPGEFTGKEAAVDAMINALKKAMGIGGGE